MLRGEGMGLQDVLVEAGAEGAARAVQLAEVEAQLAASLLRVQQARALCYCMSAIATLCTHARRWMQSLDHMI